MTGGPVQFTKMHGLGNDFILVDMREQTIERPAAAAIAWCDRRRGIGADGLILLGPAETSEADVRMRIFNADGSRAEMCGNGIRCAAKLVYERGWMQSASVRFQSDAGIRITELSLDEKRRVRAVRVDMGTPGLHPSEIPVDLPGERAVDFEITLKEAKLRGTCVSTGNPHVVIFRDDLRDVPLDRWGPAIEKHPMYPGGINVQFAQVISAERMRVITWERGVGVTKACGTGATAACVAGALNGLTGRRVTIELAGGGLEIDWDEPSDHVFMTGPAEEAFEGAIRGI